ncbi:MAG: AEC family transporter [Clostridiales Family XIII bacterium]|jgi:predicted permease|nr:AEC family transporter [Clostridiales Family XIII bacterium]
MRHSRKGSAVVTVGVVFSRVAGVFAMVLLGFIANRVGWLPSESGKYLSKIVINIAAPCAVLHSMSAQEMRGDAFSLVIEIISVSFAMFLFSALCALPIVALLRVRKEDRGVYRSFVIFSNNGFMGFPVVLAVFGSTGLFYIILSNMAAILLQYTLCIALIKRDAAALSRSKPRKESVKNRLKAVFDVPLDAALVSLAIFLLRIPVHEGLQDIFSSVGAMMAPLSMIIIGIQLAQSKIRDALLNPRLVVISVVRLALMPFLMFLILEFINIDSLVRCVIILSFAMPCAALPVVFAQEYGANAKLAAEGAFLSTLFSMACLPIACILLTLHVL